MCIFTQIAIIFKHDQVKEMSKIWVVPMDLNMAISAHAVFPQSGHISPEKQLFFQKCPHFSNQSPLKTRNRS